MKQWQEVRFRVETQDDGYVLIDRLEREPTRFFNSWDVITDIRDRMNEQWRSRFVPTKLNLGRLPSNEIPRREYALTKLNLESV